MSTVSSVLGPQLCQLSSHECSQEFKPGVCAEADSAVYVEHGLCGEVQTQQSADGAEDILTSPHSPAAAGQWRQLLAESNTAWIVFWDCRSINKIQDCIYPGIQ